MLKSNRFETSGDVFYSKCQYDKALSYYIKSKRKTDCVRRINNKIADCLIHTKKYSDAFAILNNTCPYTMIDDYDIETLRLLSILFEYCSNTFEAKLYSNSYYFFTTNSIDENSQYISQTYCSNDHIYKEFLEEHFYYSFCELEQLIIENIELLRFTELGIWLAYCSYLNYEISPEIVSLLASDRFTHVQQFAKELENINNFFMIHQCNASNEENLRFFSILNLLQTMGKKIICYSFDEDKIIQRLDSTLNIIRVDDINELKATLIKYCLTTNYEPTLLLAEHSFLKNWYLSDSKIYSILEMYYRHYEEQPIKHLDCMLLGNFYQTSSFFYRSDIKELLQKKASVDYSIIIPARNSAQYLKHAILSCLKQDFKGTYEILVSDNSDANNFAVKKCVDEICNKKVRYIRTPHVLSLSKSFEYAYLMANGEKLLSLGSDDGLVDSALSVLDEIFKKTEDNIIHFHGFFFRWPGYWGDSQLVFYEQQLPNSSNTCSLEVKYIREDMVTGHYPFQILPIMYMHTCVKREHIRKIIDITGKFEFGYSQDVYTGVLNLFLEDSITYTNIPLLVGGSSAIGIGEALNIALREGEVSTLIKSGYYFRRFENYRIFSPTYTIRTHNERKFIYEEFKKISLLNVIENIEFDYPAEYILEIIKSAYLSFPQKVNDVNVLYKQMQRFVNEQDINIIDRYIVWEKSWLQERKSVILKLKQKIRHFLGSNSTIKAFYYKFIILYKKYLKKQEILHDNSLYSIQVESIPTLFLNSKSEKMHNVEDACAYASLWLRKKYKLSNIA